MLIRRRRLPHIHAEGKSLFVTWHLHGSVPPSLLPPPGPLTAGEAFVWIDRRLDMMQTGPMYLRQPEVANLVVASIRKGVDLGHYELGAWAIMPNHVHLLIQPSTTPDRLLKSLKGASAREANRLLGRTGEPFWQRNPMITGCATIPSLKGFAFISKIIRSRQGWREAPRSIYGRALTPGRMCRHEWRHGTHECVRHKLLFGEGFYRRTRTHQVTIAVRVIDAADARPEFSRTHERQRIGRQFA